MKKVIVVAIGALLMPFLFWEESKGVNVLIFALFLLTVGQVFHLNMMRQKTTGFLSAMVLVSAACVWVHDSANAMVAFVLSVLCLGGALKAPQLKSLYLAFLAGVANKVQFVFSLFKHVSHGDGETQGISWNWSWRVLRVSVLPAVGFLVFFLIFRGANVAFRDLGDYAVEKLFSNLSWVDGESLGYFLWGAILVLWWLFGTLGKDLEQGEQNFSWSITRRKAASQMPKKSKRTLGLKREFQSAFLFLVLINGLLLLVNLLDILFVWGGLERASWSAADFSQSVHEGTYLLMLSIVLSIVILHVYFRKNLNFYPKVHRLRALAFLWIGQNMILLISVALRNWHYIHELQLAYKRIGVYIFLIAVLVGLLTLVLKILRKHTVLWMLKVNTWAWLILVVGMATVDWDRTIVQYNLTHGAQEALDLEFLLTRSDKTLDIVYSHREKLAGKQFYSYRSWDYIPQHDATAYLNDRLWAFVRKKERETWRSWTLADTQCFTHLSHQIPHVK